MEELCGVIDKIVYTSPDRVFSVFKLSEKESGRHITVTGSLGVPTGRICYFTRMLGSASSFWHTV